MIKSPFRFDIEYFSILVVLCENGIENNQEAEGEYQKKTFESKINNREQISENGREIQSHLTQQRKRRNQKLYFVVQNKKSNQCYGSTHCVGTMQIQIKTIFPNIMDIYSYVKYHCNSERIKITRRGNLLIEYFIGETIYQLKIDNQQFQMSLMNMEGLWKGLKSIWENRKEGRSGEILKYLNYTEKGNLKLQKLRQNKASLNHNLQDKFQNYRTLQKKSSKEIFLKHTLQKSHKQFKSRKKSMKKMNTVYPETADRQPAEIESEKIDIINKNREHKYADQRYKNQKKIKQYLIERDYVLHKNKKQQGKDLKNINQFQCNKKQEQLKKHSLQWGNRVLKSLKRIQYCLDNMQNREQVFERVNKFIDYKLDQAIQIITKNFDKQHQNIMKIAEQLKLSQTLSNHPTLRDKCLEKSSLKYWQEKKQSYSKEFKQSIASRKQILKRIQQQTGTDCRQIDVENVKNQLKSQKVSGKPKLENKRRQWRKQENLRKKEQQEKKEIQDQQVCEQTDQLPEQQ